MPLYLEKTIAQWNGSHLPPSRRLPTPPHHWRWDASVGGKVITRRPKSRASMEYAPGPSSAMAAAFKLESNRTRRSVGPMRNSCVSSIAQQIVEAAGVSKPKHIRTLSTPKTMQIRTPINDFQTSGAPSIRAIATETRRSNNAMPGAPAGNIEKRRSTFPA